MMIWYPSRVKIAYPLLIASGRSRNPALACYIVVDQSFFGDEIKMGKAFYQLIEINFFVIHEKPDNTGL